MSRSQLRLAAILLGLVVFVVAVYCASIERVQAEQAQEREAARLVGQARIVGLLLGEVRLHEFETARIDAIVDRAGAELGLRVTVVGADGALLGDSEIGLGRLPRLGSFASRPEIAAALATGEGASLHRSETLGREFLYGAARVRGAVVRVGTSAESLADLAAARRRSYVIGGFAASVVAIAMAWLLSGLAIRPLREMQRVASAVARGRLDDRLPLGEGTELAGIADSINKMAEQLRTRFSEADQEKERLQAVLEGMVEGVLVLDGAGVVLLANQRIRELYEVTGELVGHPFLEVIRDVDLEQTLSAALKGGDAVSRQLTTGALVPRTLQVQAARFPAEGKRLGTVAVFHDVSELARLEEVRRDFVANASHELRTPLAAIRGFAETLLSSPDLSAEAQRSYVEIIERNAVRLGNILQDLLDLSRLESRGQSIEGVDVAPLPIARRLLREYEARARDLGIRLHLECEDEALVHADPTALEQILVNLADNALKYTDAGGEVGIGIEARASKVAIWVRDTGIGIPESEQSRIFERFYRVDKARSRALGGTGLGLAIVKHMVQSMGGEIRVESRAGEGSTFTLTLPYATAAPPGAVGGA
jgi:two-component system phosphate regulon sensor histidine kinase PhoR